MLASFNTTFIALIPKVDNPRTYDDIRPISLWNCIYKVVAKVITCRSKPIWSKAISNEQSRFLEEQQIHEVPQVAKEGLHTVKT